MLEAVSSVLRQSFQNWELVVTHDGNAQSMEELVLRSSGGDPRVRYRKNSRTLGVCLNIAAALRESKGEYIAILNDDDVMEPCMLEKLLPALRNEPEATLAFGDHWLIDRSGKILATETEKNSVRWKRKTLSAGIVKNGFKLALQGGIPLVMGTLVRRRALDERWFIPEVGGAYDCWLALQLARHGKLVFVPERIFQYRVHQCSETARLAPDKAKSQVFLFSKLLEQDLPAAERRMAQKLYSYFLFVLGRDHLYFGQSQTAGRAFIDSIKKSPGRVKAYPALFASYLPHRWLIQLVNLSRSVRGIPKLEAPTSLITPETKSVAADFTNPYNCPDSRPSPQNGPEIVPSCETNSLRAGVKISCIIPTLNRGELLSETLRLLLRQTCAAHEIIIIDQSDVQDETMRKVREKWHSHSSILWLTQRQPNASAARNLGAVAASGEVLVFLDDDIRFGPQLLEAYARAFEDESVTGVAGQILEGHANVVFDLPERALAPETGWLAFPRNYGHRCSTTWMASGNFGIRKDLFLKLGGMDENYFRGAFREESDFAMRFTKVGYRFQFEPDASVYHLGIAEAPTGGSRNWTGNNRIAGWHHCIGDWYFFLGNATAATEASLLWFSVRHFVLNQHNVRRTWLIPILLLRWLSAIFPAAYLRCRGARLLSRKQAPKVPDPAKIVREFGHEVEA